MSIISDPTRMKEEQKLSPEVAQRVVRYAKRRLETSKIDDYVSKCLGNNSNTIITIPHEDVLVGEMLGQGSFSNVYEIKSIRGKMMVQDHNLVLKVLRSKHLEKPVVFAGCAADLIKEGMILASLSHANVLSCRAWSPNGADSFVTGRHDAFFLVLDRIEETLYDRLDVWRKEQPRHKQHRGMVLFRRSSSRNSITVSSLRERYEVLLDLAEGIAYLHSQRILHRDLKPCNIGFDRDGVLKLFDFDVSRVVPFCNNPNEEVFRLTRRVGSPRYMSPEVARGQDYNLKADVYSFGLLCYELLSLEKPYGDFSADQHASLVFYKGVRPILSEANWPKSIRQCLDHCWSESISKRPTMNEAKELLQRQLPLMLDEEHQMKPSSTTFSFFGRRKRNSNHRSRANKPSVVQTEESFPEESDLSRGHLQSLTIESR